MINELQYRNSLESDILALNDEISMATECPMSTYPVESIPTSELSEIRFQLQCELEDIVRMLGGSL